VRILRTAQEGLRETMVRMMRMMRTLRLLL
jgi:hypothetical protein